MTKFSIFYICFLNRPLISFKIKLYDFYIVYDVHLLKSVLNYKVVFF